MVIQNKCVPDGTLYGMALYVLFRLKASKRSIFNAGGHFFLFLSIDIKSRCLKLAARWAIFSGPPLGKSILRAWSKGGSEPPNVY